MHTRREMLKLTAAGAGAAVGFRLEGAAFSAALGLASGMFQYGVASGDPLSDRVIIWTRLTPDQSATPGSGKGAATAVKWRVAKDRALTNPVAIGTITTDATSDHTVKIDVTGLAPSTQYYYGFSAGSEDSPVGAMRTAPAATEASPRLRFALVSCSNYAAGFFTPYKYLSTRCDLDFVLHVGDYTYEYGDGDYGSARKLDPPSETTTLEHYRRRQALYKSDPDLQALHKSVAWITTIDDHETANDAWRDGAQNHTAGTEGVYRDRRNAAYQTYREWMPIRVAPSPTPDETRWYRRFTWGSLAHLSMLDLRQYRDQQPAPLAPERATTAIMNAAQLSWLTDSLRGAGPRWRLIGNSVQCMPVLYPNVGDIGFAALNDRSAINTDAWDGYPSSRRSVLAALEPRRSESDAVFLTGDIHSSWAAELVDVPTPPVPADYSPVAVEFVSTSITSDGFGEILPPALLQAGLTLVTATNPHIKFVEATKHGCSIVDVTAERVQCDWYYTTSATAADPRIDPNATVIPGASYRTKFGTKRIEPVKEDKSPAPVIDDCKPEPSPTTTASSTAATGSSAATTTTGAAVSNSDSDSDSSTKVFVPVGVAVVAGAAGAMIALRRRRHARANPAAEPHDHDHDHDHDPGDDAG